MDLAPAYRDRLLAEAPGYAALALENIAREYPVLVFALVNEPGELPGRPRDRTPVFYGSLDWHSCVEMHWVLVRLLKTAAVDTPEIRAALDAQFTPDGLAAEAEYMRTSGRHERPYGWSWALTLAHELETWDDPDARRWAAAMEPLAAVLTQNFTGWLPKEAYPVRYGMHANSAFGLSRSLGYARLLASRGQPELLTAIEDAARRWFAGDVNYPAEWEPSGHDFLSPALTEAELMASLLPRAEFADWLATFLPGLAKGQPASLLKPVAVSDPTDGQIAHLHGLNLSRAWCWRRLAEALPDADPRGHLSGAAIRWNAGPSLDHVTSGDYMVTHWLAAYAVLLLS
jgi:hypothetical protein